MGCDATVAVMRARTGTRDVGGAVGRRERHAGGKCPTGNASWLRARGRQRAPVCGNLFLGGGVPRTFGGSFPKIPPAPARAPAVGPDVSTTSPGLPHSAGVAGFAGMGQARWQSEWPGGDGRSADVAGRHTLSRRTPRSPPTERDGYLTLQTALSRHNARIDGRALYTSLTYLCYDRAPKGERQGWRSRGRRHYGR